MMLRLLRTIVLAALMLAAVAPRALAQNAPEFRLELDRNFGYGAGANVRGNFTVRVSGSRENIASVTYLIDGAEMAVVSEPPFDFRFQTDSYPPGWHELTAVVATRDGRQVTTPVVRANFLTAEQESQGLQRILIPLFGGVMVAMLIGLALQFLAFRRNPNRLEPGAPRTYGVSGGTICPRCGRAYPLHIWALNLGLWKFDRCEFCGKWAAVHRRSPEELAAAEAAERAALQGSETSLPGAGEGMSDEERLRKLLDESRYTD